MHDYNNNRMNVPRSTHVLLSQLVMWLERVTYHHKQAAFESIKRKLLKEHLRTLDKGAFVSSSTADNYSSIHNFYEFKTIEQNYTSVKIMDYETHGMKKDLRESLARRI
jgi:site-specific recombinase XerD